MLESASMTEEADPGAYGQFRIQLLEVRLRALESLVRIMLPSHVSQERVDNWISLFDEVHSQIVSTSAIEEVYQEVMAEIRRSGTSAPEDHPK